MFQNPEAYSIWTKIEQNILKQITEVFIGRDRKRYVARPTKTCEDRDMYIYMKQNRFKGTVWRNLR
jgi:hypothetical protein